jgi:hypothetical protein
VGDRLAQLTRYFDRWPESLRTKIRDPLRVARTFGVLLQGDLLETALLGGPVPGRTSSASRRTTQRTDYWPCEVPPVFRTADPIGFSSEDRGVGVGEEQEVHAGVSR